MSPSISFGVDEMGHAEALAPAFLGRVDVDADDHVGADEPEALDDVEADAAEPEHDALGAGLHMRGVDHRADAGGHAAADVADLVEGRVFADLGHRDLGQHGVVGECRGAHVVVELLAVEGEPRGAVGHQALALGGADGGAQIGLARQARRALAAFRRIERDDVVALFDAGHARADIDHDAGALMAEDRRKQPFRVGARQRELVGVADAGGLDLDQHLALPRAFEVDLGDLQRLSGLDGHCGALLLLIGPKGSPIISASGSPSPVSRWDWEAVRRPMCSGATTASALTTRQPTAIWATMAATIVATVRTEVSARQGPSGP
jgi:hypothetical protein